MPRCDVLSMFAGPYMKIIDARWKLNAFAISDEYRDGESFIWHQVGRCRLPVSKPVLKAPMVSALEAII